MWPAVVPVAKLNSARGHCDFLVGRIDRDGRGSYSAGQDPEKPGRRRRLLGAGESGGHVDHLRRRGCRRDEQRSRNRGPAQQSFHEHVSLSWCATRRGRASRKRTTRELRGVNRLAGRCVNCAYGCRNAFSQRGSSRDQRGQQDRRRRRPRPPATPDRSACAGTACQGPTSPRPPSGTGGRDRRSCQPAATRRDCRRSRSMMRKATMRSGSSPISKYSPPPATAIWTSELRSSDRANHRRRPRPVRTGRLRDHAADRRADADDVHGHLAGPGGLQRSGHRAAPRLSV